MVTCKDGIASLVFHSVLHLENFWAFFFYLIEFQRVVSKSSNKAESDHKDLDIRYQKISIIYQINCFYWFYILLQWINISSYVYHQDFVYEVLYPETHLKIFTAIINYLFKM